MPVINKSDHWDDEFERLNPEMTVKRVHSLKELKDLGFDVKSDSPNDQADPQRVSDSEIQPKRDPAVGSSALLCDDFSRLEVLVNALSDSTRKCQPHLQWLETFLNVSDVNPQEPCKPVPEPLKT